MTSCEPPAQSPRRRALGALAAATTAGSAAWLAPAARAAAPRRVAIVGAGMAGMACAWLLDGACDVSLFEARADIGGNVISLPLEVDGQPLVVDLGAQYFHPGPYPTYVQLLTELGFYPPGAPGSSHAFAASITVDAAGEATPRLVSPVLPGRAWPLLAPWNKAGVEALAVTFRAAQRREARDASWQLTLDEWLPTLGLTPAQVEGIVLPWITSLYSGDIALTRGLSARAAMVIVARAVPQNPTDPLLYYVLDDGMIAPLRRMAQQFTAVQLHTGAPVTALARRPQGGFWLQAAGGAPQAFDDVVFAASGPPTLALLQSLAGTQAQRQALGGIAFFDATLAIHRDAAYAAATPAWRSLLNGRVEGGACEASMDLARVLPAPGGAPVPPLWKSWITYRAQPPAEVLAQVQFKHMLPSLPTLAAQDALALLQGQGGLWFAGGYLEKFDSQESALVSAMGVAASLNPGGPRLARLAAAVGAGRARR